MISVFLFGPWSSLWFAGNTLDYMALLLIASLGAAIAFRGGLFNIGIEGQIYLGGLAASVVLLNAPPAPPFFVLCAAGAAACLTGAAMGFVCAVIKKKTGASELITTFLLSAALTPAADFLIANPLRDTSQNLLATKRFAGAFSLGNFMPPSNLSVSLIIALTLAFLTYIFFSKTAAGYRFRMAGDAPSFARFGGIEAENYWKCALGVSGALSGLCGFFAVTGTYRLCYQGFSGGLGWAGIAVALIARNRSLVLIPAALFYAWIKNGTDTVLLDAGMSFESSTVLQALILLLVTIKKNPFKRIKA